MTMKNPGVAELKAKLSEFLRHVRKGHEVVIMDRDQPVARLIPFAERQALVVREPVSRYRTLGDIPLPKPVKLDVDPVQLLLEDRQSR